ncbi:thermonuclease family protein [Hyphomicrobium sp. DMF-1]|uniref:thermonuclease family protein n=1 Tax=Hyphomicrobium sp. DMF-1 TaxID=3019544 RepID=UPI0022EBB134|nr:thermonuclease family protein [Hyphomicrobium sp. DMF-1]WBT39180.1 hypothetical protein PE058_04675 [Hyphomicrobium sp. DMF-1]
MDDPKMALLSRRRPSRLKKHLTNAPATWIVVALFVTALAAAYFGTGGVQQFKQASPVGASELFDGSISACGWIRRTCLVDGDTGWQGGRKWRLIGIDAPELANAECGRERELAQKSLHRLTELMASGYRIVWSGKDDRYGRALVNVTLADGRDAGSVLKTEKLAQSWPNRGNVWCER